MNFLHYDLQLGPGDVVEVTLNQRANVRLLDETNFSRYQRGEQHNYHGGMATKTPVRLRPPHAGHWHLVIDLGGYAGSVNASVRTVKG